MNIEYLPFDGTTLLVCCLQIARQPMHILRIGTLRGYLQWEFADLTGKEQSSYGTADAYEGGQSGASGRIAANSPQVRHSLRITCTGNQNM